MNVKLAKNYIIRREVDGGAIFNILTYRCGAHKTLNHLATDILEACENGASVEETIKNVAYANPQIKQKWLAVSIEDFIKECLKRGVLEQTMTYTKGLSGKIIKENKKNASSLRRLSAPILLSINPTLRCNQKCEFCYLGDISTPSWQEKDINLWKRVVDEAVKNKVPFIDIIGGEPFLYKDIMPLLEYIDSQNINYIISSNGTLITEEDAVRIGNLDRRKLHFNLSIEGPDAKTHDKIVCLKGAFKRAMKAADLLRENNVEFGINTVIYNHTEKNIKKIYEMVIKRKIPSQIISYYSACAKVRDDIKEISVRQFFKDIQMLEKLNEESDKKILISREGPCLWILDNSKLPRDLVGIAQSGCQFGFSRLDIMPNGDVYPCGLAADYKEFLLGNIDEIDMSDLWKSRIMDKIRKIKRQIIQKEPCRECRFREGCKGVCYFYCKNNGFDTAFPDPRCPLVKEYAEKT